jgi:hypothetical protein
MGAAGCAVGACTVVYWSGETVSHFVYFLIGAAAMVSYGIGVARAVDDASHERTEETP